MKYIVYVDDNTEYLVSFPRKIDHVLMAEAMENLRFGGRIWHRNQGEILAAGFIDSGKCHGKSETLGIVSRGDVDTQLLKAGGCAPTIITDQDN